MVPSLSSVNARSDDDNEDLKSYNQKWKYKILGMEQKKYFINRLSNIGQGHTMVEHCLSSPSG